MLLLLLRYHIYSSIDYLHQNYFLGCMEMEQATVILAWSRDVLKLKRVVRNSSARSVYSFKNMIFNPNPTK